MVEKSQRILEAAIKEFATHGYLKTKTEAIAQQANVSKGLIFHKFKTKQALYGEAVAVAIKRLEQEMAYSELGLTSLVELFSHSMRIKLQLTEKYPWEIQLLIDAYSNLEHFPPDLVDIITNYLEESRKESYQIIADLIDKLPLRDSVKKEDVSQLVLMLFNQMELEARAIMAEQKMTDLDFLDELVKRAETYMAILESGFLA